jgi:transcription elongation GreA/GreB family factor
MFGSTGLAVGPASTASGLPDLALEGKMRSKDRRSREGESMISYKRAGVDDGAPRVGLGSRVVVELIDGGGEVERLCLAVVPDDKADFQAGYLGAGTRLAAAIMGQEAGQTVPYPYGDLIKIRIVDLEPFAVSEAPDASGARQAVIQKAVDKSDLQDTLRLALAVSVKWGDYDPNGILPEDEPSEE